MGCYLSCMDIKHCSRCKSGKPRAEFNKSASAKDGLASWCRTCNSAYHAEWRKANAAGLRDYQRAYRADPANKARLSAQLQERRAGSGHSGIAHRATVRVNNSVRDGLVPRVTTLRCAGQCGRQAAQYHHDDYNYPLMVRPLCKACHRLWHKHYTPIYPGEGN